MKPEKMIKILGYGGLVPFVVCAIMIWFDEPFNPYLFLQAFIIYSLMVLSFLCGSWWGMALSGIEEKTRLRLLSGSVIILVTVWLVMVFKQNQWWSMAFLAIAYVMVYMFEQSFRKLPAGEYYLRMRMVLTVVVVLCHASVTYYLYQWLQISAGTG